MEENTTENTESTESTEASASDSEVLVIASKIKALVKALEPEMRVAGDFAEGLTVRVKQLVLNALQRAKANKRGTVQGRDA